MRRRRSSLLDDYAHFFIRSSGLQPLLCVTVMGRRHLGDGRSEQVTARKSGPKLTAQRLNLLVSISPLQLGEPILLLCVGTPAVGRCKIRVPESKTYSITPSARVSRVGGKVSPSDFAVLRLITRSYLIGACTGRSAGFSPFRMRSTYPAARR